MRQGFSESRPAVRAIPEVRQDIRGFKYLNPRSKSDPMLLHPRVMEELDNYFSIRSATYLSGQRELLAQAAEAVLQEIGRAHV